MDDEVYIGQGPSKKTAKLEAAKHVLEKKFNIIYNPEVAGKSVFVGPLSHVRSSARRDVTENMSYDENSFSAK